MKSGLAAAARWLVAGCLAAGLGGISSAAAQSTPVGSTAPDLVMTVQMTPLFPKLGSTVFLESKVENHSAAATSLVMTTTVSGLVQYHGFYGPGWSCLASVIGTIGLTAYCSRAGLASSAASSITFSMTAPLTPGAAYYTSTVTSAGYDLVPGDNHASTIVTAFAHSANGNPWDLNDSKITAYSDSDDGAVIDGGQDAFDTFGLLRVREADFPPAEAFIAHLDLNFSVGGHWRTVTPVGLNPVTISRRIDAPPGTDWIRYLDTFTNTDGEFPAHVLVLWGGDLGSDLQTATRATSSGNQVLASNDTWAVTVQQNSPSGGALDAPVGFAFRSPSDSTFKGPYLSNQAAVTSTVWPSAGNDKLGFVFEFTLAPFGNPNDHAELAYFLYRGLAEGGNVGPQDCQFYGTCVQPANGSQVALAASTVAALAANPPFCDLSPAELSQIINWPGVTQRCLFVPLVVK